MEEQTQNLSKVITQEETDPSLFFKSKPFIILLILVVGLGVISGYCLSRQGSSSNSTTKDNLTVINKVSPDKIKVGAVFGSPDQVFKDTTIGTLEKNGLEGEGTHKLIREGGPSQTAYVTSSTLDLDQFLGKKVQIWGETFKAQKAGWLMDVGRLKILE